MVRAGPMRHTIRIEEQTASVDAAGQPLSSWSLVAERRASLERTPGSEVWAAAQRNARVPVVFRIRYTAGVLPKMRVVFDGRNHNLTSVVDPTGLKEEMLLTAEEEDR